MGSRPSVCLSVCCVNTGDQEQLKENTEMIKNQWDKLTVGWNWLVPLYGVRPEGEGGETTHRPHPFFTHIHLPVNSEAQLAKKKKKNQSAQNGLNFSYSVVK